MTDRAPEVMVKPVPVISVMALSEPTLRLSVKVVVALRMLNRESKEVRSPVTLKVESMVEEAKTKMPAVVEVGVKVG